jgi:thiol-disulfide isomerase/thioredoxin
MSSTNPNHSALSALDGAPVWLNSDPLTAAGLRGRVVLVDFWTYSCVNWLRTLPYVRAWHERYRDRGLVVVGVHAPEFGFEHDLDNVRRAATAHSPSADVPASPPARAHPPADLRDHVRRPGRARVRLHLRLIRGERSNSRVRHCCAIESRERSQA